MSQKYILGIETSCDDTSIAILKGNPEDKSSAEIIAMNLYSQEKDLSKWGGVVPEIAARNHLDKLSPLIKKTLDQASIGLSDIDLIGVTTNPGLLGPLLTGLNAAKTISLMERKPIIPVNHLYAHLEAIHLTEKVNYPYLGLLVSGGHSLYLLVSSEDDFKILGSTIDDAAGEAFDKGGKLMGLGYPAGRIIDDLAKDGDISAYSFPIGLKSTKNADLSYSGVKTSLRTFCEKNPQITEKIKNKNFDQEIKDVCASYQHAIVSALKLKLRYAYSMATELTGKKLPIVLGGGVACNSYLRKMVKDNYKDSYFVQPKYCTDNGGMIANYAFRTYNSQVSFPECLKLDARGRFISKNDNLIKAKKQKEEFRNKQRQNNG